MDDASIERYRAAESLLWAEAGWEPDEQWVDFREGRIRVLSSGTGEPVVCVHGGPNAGSTWSRLAGLLSDRFRVIVMDRPGCGLSDPLSMPADMPPDEWWQVMGDMVGAVVDGCADGPAHVVASSYGGACALALASASQQRVERLVLQGTPALDGMKAPMNMRMLGAGPIGRFIARQKATRGSTRMTFRQIGHKRLVASGWPQGADLEWGLAMMNDTDTMRNEVDLIQRAATWRGFRKGWLLDPGALGSVKARTLWIAGDSEPFASAEMLQAWSSAIPDSRLVVRPGCGHLPWMDEPEGNAAMVAEFLSAD